MTEFAEKLGRISPTPAYQRYLRESLAASS
jgi:hypothetical protein